MINVSNIFKRYGNKKVLNDVTFEFPKGKLIAFIGSNGAGKSTLLSIITRTLAKSDGKVFVDNKELSEWKNKELAKRISVLRQTNQVNIRIKVSELVAFGRFPHSGGNLTNEDNVLIEKAINYMGLSELKDRYIDELSGGQRQMAYIAMVLAQDTEYIFLDEPLNNLDMKHSAHIMKLIKRLVDEEGKTIIVVIHDINFVSAYADYVIGMKDGQIIKGGELNEIINKETLKTIYDIDIDVKDLNNKKICLYYS